MTSYVERLARRSREVGSYVCVGLDPHRLPQRPLPGSELYRGQSVYSHPINSVPHPESLGAREA